MAMAFAAEYCASVRTDARLCRHLQTKTNKANSSDKPDRHSLFANSESRIGTVRKRKRTDDPANASGCAKDSVMIVQVSLVCPNDPFALLNEMQRRDQNIQGAGQESSLSETKQSNTKRPGHTIRPP